MPGFQHTLIGVGPICDANFSVLFNPDSVKIFDPTGRVILSGWRETIGAKLWRMALIPDAAALAVVPDPPPLRPGAAQLATLSAYSAYDLPSVEALVRYLHAAAGFPVKSTWLKAIKAGNFASWPGLTFENASKYCPTAEETILGHLVQTRQGLRSTKPKPPQPQSEAVPHAEAPTKSSEIHFKIEHISKLYTDDTGRFPVRARSGNQYIMIAYHCDTNAILACPFASRKDSHRLKAYATIMTRLRSLRHSVDLQILDNEASTEYKRQITEEWGARFQLVPPNIHRSNAAERAIRTFKAHFLSILAGVAPDYPRNLWDLLLPQAELTLNLLRQATFKPTQSAWEAFHGAFNYASTPVGPLGCSVISHRKPGNRHSWDFRGHAAWNVGVSLEHYRCQRIVAKDTKSSSISDTLEFRHHHLTLPALTSEDRIAHGLDKLTCALRDAPAIVCDNNLAAIEALKNALGRWVIPEASASAPVADPPKRLARSQPLRPAQRAAKPAPISIRPPKLRPLSQPVPVETVSPIAHRTRSRTSERTATQRAAPPRVVPTSSPRVHPAASPRVIRA